MRGKKAFMALFLAAALFLGVFPLGRVNAASAESAYKKYMEEYSGKVKVPSIDGYNDWNRYYQTKWKPKKRSVWVDNFEYYKIVDINGSGPKELLLSKSKHGQGNGEILVCTYNKGKVVPVFYAKGVRIGVFNAKGGQFVIGYGAAGTAAHAFLKLSGTKFKHKGTFVVSKEYDPFRYVYHKNAKKISKKKYNTQIKRIKTKAFSFKEI